MGAIPSRSNCLQADQQAYQGEGRDSFYTMYSSNNREHIAEKANMQEFGKLLGQLGKRKTPDSFAIRGLFQCPGLDSNQHAVSSTTTSRWLVYQFQHLGIPLARAANVRNSGNCVQGFAKISFRQFGKPRKSAKADKTANHRRS